MTFDGDPFDVGAEISEIFLEIFVKVDKDWRSSQKELDAFGYNPE